MTQFLGIDEGVNSTGQYQRITRDLIMPLDMVMTVVNSPRIQVQNPVWEKAGWKSFQTSFHLGNQWKSLFASSAFCFQQGFPSVAVADLLYVNLFLVSFFLKLTEQQQAMCAYNNARTLGHSVQYRRAFLAFYGPNNARASDSMQSWGAFLTEISHQWADY